MYFGRRFNVNSAKRADAGEERDKKVGTFVSIAKAVKDSRQALVQQSGAAMSQGTLVPGLALGSLAGEGDGARTDRQQQIATSARNKLTKLRQDAWVGRGAAGVSAAAPPEAHAEGPAAKAKAKAKGSWRLRGGSA